MATDTYFARRPFGYHGQEIDREQIVLLVGPTGRSTRNEQLERLGYVAKVEAGTSTFPCRHCPAQFLSLGALNAHGHKRHAPPSDTPRVPERRTDETDREYEQRVQAQALALERDEDRALEREERELDALAPLYVEKTAAARA